MWVLNIPSSSLNSAKGENMPSVSESSDEEDAILKKIKLSGDKVRCARSKIRLMKLPEPAAGVRQTGSVVFV